MTDLVKKPPKKVRGVEGLTPIQRTFLDAYLSNGQRCAQAYGAATGKDPKTFNKIDKRMAYSKQYLKHPVIQGRIREANAQAVARTEEIIEKYVATKEDVVRELAKIAFAKPTDFMEWDNDKGVTVKPSSEIDPGTMGAITRVTSGKDKKVRIELDNKRQALVDLGKALGLFTEKHQHEHKAVSINFVIEK